MADDTGSDMPPIAAPLIGFDAALHAALAASPDIPAGDRGAFVTQVSGHDVRAIVAAKLNGVWWIQAEASHPWKGGLEGGVTVHASW